MERLKSGILLVVIGLTAGSVQAQQGASSSPPAGSVAVIGDVERCENYPVPTDSALTVRQAVLNAGLVSEIVSVKVIRATQDTTQFTQVISANSADNGEPVENGDVLLVQSMSPIKAVVRKNAALRTDSGVIVVGLEEDGIKIGDVLLYAQTTPPAAGQLKVISRFQGRPPIAKAELHSPTEHGDVISVSHDNRRVLKGFGNMAPAVSEWKTQSVSLPMASASATTLDAGLDSSTSNELSKLPPFELPALPTDTMFLPIPGDDTPESNGSAPDVAAKSSASTNTLPISQSEDIADTASETADGKISFASESTTAAPMAPAELKTGVVAVARSSNFNPWNLIFVGGLLLAGTLILAGTLRPDPDDDSKFIETAARESVASSRRFNSTPTAPPTLPARQITQKSELPAEKVEDVMSLPMTSAAAEFEKSVDVPAGGSAAMATTLVASHEWFSGDWNGQVVLNHDNPEDTAACVDSSAHVTIPEAPAVPGCSAAIQKPVTSAKSVREDLPAADLIVNDAEAAKIVSAIDEIVASGNAVANEVEDQSKMSALEDLLQNRLPIDLCDAQLPLRIDLFGTPAGPRRLRIDAAHKTVPAPHVNLTSEKRREQRATVSASSAPNQTAPNQTAENQTAENSSGGLDRALHFLQERTES